MNEPSYYRVSIKGIVIDDEGRILLAREDNGMWDMLGGGLEHGEEPKECLVREIKEETGLNIVYISDNPLYFITGPRYASETFVAHAVYEIKLESLKFIPSEECQELRFFSVNELNEVKLFPTVEKLKKLLADI